MAQATKQYNDFELLYMAQDGSNEALEILINKYKPLIITKLISFKIKKAYYDDYIQEGLLTLYKSIYKYDSNSKMSFTKYFDMVLTSKIIDLLRKNKKYFENSYLCEDIDIVVAYTPKHEDYNVEKTELLIKELSVLEKDVFILKYKENKNIDQIASILSIPKRRVYAANDRIKNKANGLK